jgi:hypothetical protein
MKTSDFRKTLTSSHIKENINKMFEMNVELNKYSREQLEDLRNKLRTRVFQHEGKAGINELLTNEAYQKDKAMLELLNTRIKEMLGEDIKKLRDKMTELSEAKKGVRDVKHTKKAKGSVKPDFLDVDKDGDKKEPMKKAAGDKKGSKPQKGVNPFAKKDEKVKEGAKPDFLDVDKDGDKKEPMKKAAKEKSVKEEWPDPKKMAAADTGKFEKKKVGKGTVYSKKADDKDDAGEKKGSGQSASIPTSTETGKYGSASDRDMMAKRKAERSKIAGRVVKGKAQSGPQPKDKTDESVNAFRRNVKLVNESLGYLLNENEEEKAKAITAASDIVNDFTSWMQRVGQYQTKSMIELADAIKADFGPAESEAFKTSVGPALQATLDTLVAQREAISNAVAVLAGEAVPETPMGAEPGAEMPPEPEMDMAAPDELNPEPAGDEFGASDAAAGAGAPGREMRESRFARKLAESHSIMAKLAK